MRKLLLNVFLPMLALAGIAFVVAYPRPADTHSLVEVAEQLAPATPEITQEGSYVRTLVEAHATATPALQPSLERVSTCLRDLAVATAEERQACAPLILDALTAIALAEKGRGQFPLPEPNPGVETIQNQIAVAAIDLCRSQWLDQRDPTSVPNTAICQAANVRLVNAPPD